MRNVLLFTIMLFSIGAFAQISNNGKMTFQGSLFQNGEPFNGTAELTFSMPLSTETTWTETISGVSIANGLYSVVLGNTTPIPLDIFKKEPERTVAVTVDGTALGDVKIYPSFIPGVVDVDSVFTNSIYIENEENGNFTQVTDSYYRIRNEGEAASSVYLTNGGSSRLQLADFDENGNTKSLNFFSAFSNGNANLSMERFTDDGNRFLQAELYSSNLFIDGTELANGYKRGGLDLYNNRGEIQSYITSLPGDSDGPDSDGFSALFGLRGTSTVNFSLEGKRWENNNLPAFSMFGEHTNGDGWFNRNVALNVESDGTNNWGILEMFHTIEGAGGETRTVEINGETGDAMFAGTVDVAGLTIGGEPLAQASVPDVIDVDTLYAYALGIGTDLVDNATIDSDGNAVFNGQVEVGSLLVDGEEPVFIEYNDTLTYTVQTGDSEPIGLLIGVDGPSQDAAPNYGFIGFGETDGWNIATSGISTSNAAWDGFTYGIYGRATGEGTGLHYGVRGEADATNAWNVGMRGMAVQANNEANYGGWFSGRNSTAENVGVSVDANGTGKYQFGILTNARGEGNGDDFSHPEGSSANIGIQSHATDNLFQNVAVRGFAEGDVGESFVGIDGISHGGGTNTNVNNTGISGNATGPGFNQGVYGYADGGTENWAGWFEGNTKITGDLIVDGEYKIAEETFWRNSIIGFTGGPDGGGGVLNHGGAAIGRKDWDANPYLGFMHVNGNTQFQPVVRAEAMTHDGLSSYGYISVNNESTENITLDGENGHAYFAGDVTIDGNLNANINPNFTNLNVADNGASASINIVNDPGGNDPSGYTAEMFLWGDATPNIQMGGQPWENGDLANFGLFGSNPDGGGWYYGVMHMGAGRDNGTGEEWGGMSIEKNDGVSSSTMINLDGQFGNGDFAGNLNVNGDISASNVFMSGSNPVGFNNDFGGVYANEHIAGDHWDDGVQLMNGAVQGFRSTDATDNDNGEMLFNLTKGSGTFEYGQLTLAQWDGVHGNPTTETINLNGENGDAYFAGDVNSDANMNALAFNTTSDKRFKKNIKTLDNALENTLKMRGVSYNWIDKNKTDRDQIGVIAQEVEAIYPEFVHTNEAGYKSVNYAQMTAVLIEAVKELNAEISALKAENMELKAEVSKTAELSSRIETIEKLLELQVVSSTSSAKN